MKLNKSIAVSENGFVFNPASGDSFSANSVGADILNMLKEEKDIKTIKDAISKKYEVSMKDLERDFDDFIAQLRDHYLIENA